MHKRDSALSWLLRQASAFFSSSTPSKSGSWSSRAATIRRAASLSPAARATRAATYQRRSSPSEGELRRWFVAARVALAAGDRDAARRIVSALDDHDPDFEGVDELKKALN